MGGRQIRLSASHSIVFAKLFLYVFLHNLVLRGGLRMFEGAGAENIRRGTQLYAVGHRHAESQGEFIVKTSHYQDLSTTGGQPTGHFSSIIFFFFSKHGGTEVIKLHLSFSSTLFLFFFFFFFAVIPYSVSCQASCLQSFSNVLISFKCVLKAGGRAEQQRFITLQNPLTSICPL